ncbi:MAG TPA: YihY/virulence factor BrkB family protein [Thermomicrobiales bacterium]|nr:YihY/virulence factor BrkB family protein [Thermomicrobiales bacterium]
MKLSQVDWVAIGKDAGKDFGKDQVSLLANAMAYNFVFALFPFVAFIFTLAVVIGQAVSQGKLFDSMMNYFYSVLPSQTADMLRGPLSSVVNQSHGFALVVGALLALYSASGGVQTIMTAFNRAYGVQETRNFVVAKVTAVLLTLALSVLLVGGFVLLIFGDKIGTWVAGQIGLGAVFETGWNVVRVILALIGVSLALALLYWKAPDIGQRFVWISPGSVLTTIVWLVATILFGLYVRLIGGSGYSKTYGALAGIILFLFYLNLVSIILVMGAELNSAAARRYDPETIRDKITDPRKQIPGKQPAPAPRAAHGEGGASTAAIGARMGDDGHAAPDPAATADREAEERLRAIRQRPFGSAEERARLAQERLPAAERARRARAAVAAVGVSAATAVGGVLVGSLRRRAPR